MFPGPTMAAMLMPRRVTATTVVRKGNVPVNGTPVGVIGSGGTSGFGQPPASPAHCDHQPVIAPGVTQEFR